MLDKTNAKLGARVESEGDQKRNPHQFRSIYSQLVAQHQKEQRKEERRKRNLKKKRKEREKQRKALQKQAKEAATSSPAQSPASPGDHHLDFQELTGIDLNTVDVADIQGSLAFRSIRGVTGQFTTGLSALLEAFESIQNQDKIPFWIKDIQKVEGDFGAGVASVFSLKRWLFCINAYMAAMWVVVVIMPYVIFSSTAWGAEDQKLSWDGARSQLASGFLESSGSWDETDNETSSSALSVERLPGPDWLYYSSYSAKLGTYRLDFAYLATVIVLFLMNMSGVIRNIAYTIGLQFQTQIHDDDHSFAASSLLFAGYDYRSCLRTIVVQNQKQIHNNLKAILMKERAKQSRQEGGLKGKFKRGAGFMICTVLAVVMGYSIIWTLQNSLWLSKHSPIPNTTNNIITLIKVIIPKLIPKIVKLEGRKDTGIIMNTIIQRVFLCQIVSLGVMFNELNDMQKVAAAKGECFEDVAGDIYMRSLLTDFFASMIQLAMSYMSKWLTYWRWVYGGYCGRKEPVPSNIAMVLTREKLPEYEPHEAAIEVISNLYRQCVIWVGATVSPAMALAGMVNNLLLFFFSKWSTKALYRPPSNPWGGNEAKALNSKLLFLTLVFSAAPLLAWIVRSPSCGPHQGHPVISTYQDYMETEVSDFTKNTIGKATVFLFDGPPLFFLLTTVSVLLYFQSAKNHSLKDAVQILKKDFKLQHKERVAIVTAAMAFESQGFVLPRAWENEKLHVARIEKFGTVEDVEAITWADINANAEVLSEASNAFHRRQGEGDTPAALPRGAADGGDLI